MGQAALLPSSQELWVLTINYPGLLVEIFQPKEAWKSCFDRLLSSIGSRQLTSVSDNWIRRGGAFLGCNEKRKRSFRLFVAGDRFKGFKHVRKALCH